MVSADQIMSYEKAHNELADVYQANGLGFPPEDVADQMYPSVFITVLGGGFADGQFRPDVSQIPGVSPGNVAYFEGVRAAIRENPENPKPETLELGKMYGRWLASASDIGIFPPNHKMAISIGEDSLTTPEGQVPFAVKEGSVMEYGMGINGLFAHRQNLQDDKYQLVHVGNSPLENAMLGGMAGFYGIDESQLVLEHSGITAVTSDLLRDDACRGETDAIIASYVQMAEDLPTGARNARDLLRTGGMLVLRGPRYDSTGAGYEKAAEAAIAAFGSDAVVLNKDYETVSPDGTKTAPSLTLVVQNPEN